MKKTSDKTTTSATLRELLGSQNVDPINQPRVPLDMIWWHPKGHALHHARIDDPVRPALRDNILANGIIDAIMVRIEYDGDKERLALVYGANRVINGLAAQKIMREKGSPHLKDGHLWVKVKTFVGTDAELLLERRREDKQPLKTPHSTRVLCDEIVALTKHNVEPEVILENSTRDWTLSIIAVVAQRWHTADDALRARFNEEVIPPAVLPHVLKAPPSERMKILSELLQAGVTTVGGATRALSRARRAADNDAAERTSEAEVSPIKDLDDDFENSGLDAAGSTEKAPTTPTPPKLQSEPRVRVKPPLEAQKPAVVRQLRENLDGLARVTSAQRTFVIGAEMGLGVDYVREKVLKYIESLQEPARIMACALLWRMGIFDASVQRHVPKEVLEMLGTLGKKPEKAPKPPKPQKEPKAPKSPKPKKEPKARGAKKGGRK